jgi:hypothetical protein
MGVTKYYGKERVAGDVEERCLHFVYDCGHNDPDGAQGESGVDTVNHPTHYQGKNECIDVMVAMFGKEAVKHFCMCNAYKYRFRSDKKNGDEDIKKAEFYETYLINMGGIDES